MSGSDSPGPRTASVEPMSGRRRGHDRIAGTGSRPASDRLRGSARRRLHPRTSAGTRAGSWGSQAVPRADPTSCGLLKQRDKHHRSSLWKAIGGPARAQHVNREIARHIDVMIGNEEDFTAALGFEVEGVDENISAIEVERF